VEEAEEEEEEEARAVRPPAANELDSLAVALLRRAATLLLSAPPPRAPAPLVPGRPRARDGPAVGRPCRGSPKLPAKPRRRGKQATEEPEPTAPTTACVYRIVCCSHREPLEEEAAAAAAAAAATRNLAESKRGSSGKLVLAGECLENRPSTSIHLRPPPPTSTHLHPPSSTSSAVAAATAISLCPSGPFLLTCNNHRSERSSKCGSSALHPICPVVM
jgi:hypothetical protein